MVANSIREYGVETVASGIVKQFNLNQGFALKEQRYCHTRRFSFIFGTFSVDNGKQSLAPEGHFKLIPVNVLNGGMDALGTYLGSFAVSGECRRRVKILLIGYHETGKTTLLNLLLPLKVAITIHRDGQQVWQPNGLECTAEIKGSELCIKSGSLGNQFVKIVQLDKRWRADFNKDDKGRIKLSSLNWELRNEQIDITVPDNSTGKNFLFRIRHLVRSRAADAGLSSHGVDVQTCKLLKDTNGDITATSDTDRETLSSSTAIEIIAWDFAGQKEYYNTHHFFLRDQALFVVVWDVTKMPEHSNNDTFRTDKDLEFWFGMLRTNLPPYGKSIYQNTKILVIGTHVDKLPLDQQSSTWREKRDKYVRKMAQKVKFNWPLEIKEICATSPKDSDLADLKLKIFELATNLGGDGLQVPESYNFVEGTVDEMVRDRKANDEWPIVTLSDVYARVKAKVESDDSLNGAVKDQLMNESVVHSALEQLNVWGHIVFQPKASNDVVLSPTFLAHKVVGDLLRSSKKGYLKLSDFAEIWQNMTRKGKEKDDCGKLLKWLQEFDVCFASEDSISGSELFLIPALLEERNTSEQLEEWRAEVDSERASRSRQKLLELLTMSDSSLSTKASITGLDLLLASTSQDQKNASKHKTVEYARVFHFDFMPPFLVPRVISRLHSTLQYSDGVWSNCALFHDKERHSVGLLLLIDMSDRVGGQLMVRTQSTNKIAALDFLDIICTTIKECLSFYPGVQPDHLLECSECNHDCQQRLQQIADDLIWNIEIVSSVDTEPSKRCTRHLLRKFKPRMALEKGGHVTPLSENIPSAMLPYSDEVLEAILSRVICDIEASNKNWSFLMYSNLPVKVMPSTWFWLQFFLLSKMQVTN